MLLIILACTLSYPSSDGLAVSVTIRNVPAGGRGGGGGGGGRDDGRARGAQGFGIIIPYGVEAAMTGYESSTGRFYLGSNMDYKAE